MFRTQLTDQLTELKESGLYKSERIITSQQQAEIAVRANGTTTEVLNFCANNYLGLANNKRLTTATKNTVDSHGFGLASVRFICGTQDIHTELERELADFVGQEAAILYTSCFDANGGLFATLFDERDAIISDELNHASIIDGIRLCKAMRYRYHNNDMAHLEEQLKAAKAANARHILIATDGVFSMDGIIADLAAICDLADEYGALVMVDDSHATGFVGAGGRGAIEHCNVLHRVDIVTSTLGKALGGASGGFTAASKEIVEWLRQRSRPYLFSNTVAPAIVGTTLEALKLVKESGELREKLAENAKRFRSKMAAAGFTLEGADHPIIPVMIGDAQQATELADALLARGVYVIAFSFPVVPHGTARIRTQMSAAHTPEQIDFVVQQFTEAATELGILTP